MGLAIAVPQTHDRLRPGFGCRLPPSTTRPFLFGRFTCSTTAPEASLCVRGVRLLATPGATPGPLIDLWIAGAYLAAIIPAGTAPVAAGVQTLDAASCLAVPGLVNAHTHWYTALLADTVPGAPLDLFVLEAMARLAPRSPRMVYVCALVHGLLLLKRGVTGLVDHVRHGVLPSVEALGACVRAYRDLGLRATVAPIFEDCVF